MKASPAGTPAMSKESSKLLSRAYSCKKFTIANSCQLFRQRTDKGRNHPLSHDDTFCQWQARALSLPTPAAVAHVDSRTFVDADASTCTHADTSSTTFVTSCLTQVHFAASHLLLLMYSPRPTLYGSRPLHLLFACNQFLCARAATKFL